jgi:hypothetical protein
MRRAFPAAVCLDEDALCRLNRYRRGQRQPLSRMVNAIVNDFLDAVRSEPPPRGRRTPSPRHRRRA